MRSAIHAFLLLCVVAGARPARADVLDDFLRLQTGSFSSAAQARQDLRYDLALWHIVEIWQDTDAGERWTYTESWLHGAERPYLQRISRLRAGDDGAVRATRYTIPDAAAWVGAWQKPSRFASLPRAGLVEVPGCEAVFARAGKDRFEGGTVGSGCRNAYKGSSYAISSMVLEADGMMNWDRGFDAGGELRWGPAEGGYRFRRVGAASDCVDPVRLLVFGEVNDRKAFGSYARALAESGLYPANGGHYEAITPALEVFEGAPPPGRGVIIARFPCLAAAQRFWRSDEYARIRKLREGIAEFEVLVLPTPPLPKR